MQKPKSKEAGNFIRFKNGSKIAVPASQEIPIEVAAGRRMFEYFGKLVAGKQAVAWERLTTAQQKRWMVKAIAFEAKLPEIIYTLHAGQHEEMNPTPYAWTDDLVYARRCARRKRGTYCTVPRV